MSRMIAVPHLFVAVVCAVSGCSTGRQPFPEQFDVFDPPPVPNVVQAADTIGKSPLPAREKVSLELVSAQAAHARTLRDSEKPQITATEIEEQENSLPTHESSVVGRPTTPGQDATVSAVDVGRADENSDSDNWNLQDLQNLALQHNPAILQAKAAASRADGIHNQTGLRPNPRIGYSAQEIGNEGARGLHGAFVSQLFVRSGKLALNELVVGHEVQMRRWNEKVQRQRVLTDVQLHFVAALAAQRRLELTRAFRLVVEQGVQIARQRVEAKFAGRADILQSENQLSRIDLAIRQTKLQQSAAWQQLAAVVGLPDLSPGTLQGSLELNEHITNQDDVLSRLLTDSPLLAMARYRVSRARADLQRQQVQKTPNLTAQLGTGHDGSTGDAFANLQFSLPLPAHNRNQGNIHAAGAELCEATQNVRRLRLQIRRDLAVEMRDYESAMAAVEQYRDVIIPRAKETLELMKLAQAGGQYNFLRVLTARRAFFDATISCVDASEQLAIADARIRGFLLTGGLSSPVKTPLSTGLRGQTLSQQ